MKKRNQCNWKQFSISLSLLAVFFVCNIVQVQAIESEGVEITEVYSFDELCLAMEAADDGDTIGIAALIEIPANVIMGYPDKHITLKRLDIGNYPGLQLASDENATFQFENITFDGDFISADSYIIVYGDARFYDCNFVNCITPYSGGALQIRAGNTYIDRCVFDTNTASLGGHISINYGNSLSMYYCTFVNGIADTSGGAINIQNSDTDCVVQNCIIMNNISYDIGGGIRNMGNLYLQDTKIIYNTATIGGADIANYGFFEPETDISILEEIYQDEEIKIDGWEQDYVDDSGYVYWLMAYSDIVEEEPYIEDDTDDLVVPEGDEVVDQSSESTTNTTNTNTSYSSEDNSENTYAFEDNSEIVTDYSGANPTATVNNYYTVDITSEPSSSSPEASTIIIEAPTIPTMEVAAPSFQTNVKIEAIASDCIFEVTEEGYNIVVNANKQEEPVIVDTPTLSEQSEESSVNIYELIQIALLGVLVVIVLVKKKAP